MKAVFCLIILISFDLAACEFRSVAEVQIPDELKSFVPQNCFDFDQTGIAPNELKEKHCDCIAQENAKYALDFGTSLYDSFRKRALARLWEHHEKSLYALSENFIQLESDLFKDNKEIGNTCRKLLKDDLENLSCGSKKTILPIEKIKSIARTVYPKIRAVSKARLNGLNGPYTSNREQALTCPNSNVRISEVDLIDYELKANRSLSMNLKNFLLELPSEITQKYKSMDEIISSDEFLELMMTDPALVKKINTFVHDAARSPQLSPLIENPNLVDIIQKENFFLDELEKANQAKLLGNCEAIKESTINILCSDRASNIFPTSYRENKAIVQAMERGTQGNLSQINIYQANNLSANFCSDQYNKDYTETFRNIRSTFPQYLTSKGKTDYDYIPGSELAEKNHTNKLKTIMCPYFPPPEENRERLAAKVAECDANPDTVMSYECIMVKTISADFTAKEEALIKAKTLSLQAQDLPDEEIEKKVKEYKKSLGTDELLAKSEPKGPLKEFLKADKSETQVAETKTNEKRSERGEAYDGSSSAGFGGELSNGELASSDQNSQGMLNRTPAEIVNSPEVNRNVQKNMNDLYDEVRRRIQTAKTAHQNSPLGQKSKSVPSYLAPAFDMPKTASDDTGGAAIAATPSGIEGQNLMPGGNGFLPPLDPTSTEASAAESYNKALLDANEAKQARKAAEAAQAARAAGRSPASSGPSPIAISGFGPNALHTEIPSLTISGGLDEALDKMLQGDFDNAELLLDLLKADKKTILIVPEKNPKYAVRVEKRGDTYLVTPENPEMVDADYRVFVDSIKESLNIKDRFKTFVAKLQSLLRGQNENGQIVPAGVDVLNNLFD
ncbi:MAG: hypothetical protein VYA54_00355 [Bdellovibrionota bacterium]|nr:hypothetical protein [Bdellovibrionota bacterium]